MIRRERERERVVYKKAEPASVVENILFLIIKFISCWFNCRVWKQTFMALVLMKRFYIERDLFKMVASNRICL